jgi:hypothetical protein
MIVIGADTHKRSHTLAAIAAGTGELLGEQTVVVGKRGFEALLRWARDLGADRVIGERANRMSNRARAIKLLDLQTVGLNGRANERAFAKAIRIYLEGRQGRPQLNEAGWV